MTKSLSLTKGPSIRPSSISPTCADADFTLVYSISASRKALGIKRHAECHRKHCKRCQTPEAKTARMFERRGWSEREIAEICATGTLAETNCREHLRYGVRDAKRMQSLLEGLHRSRKQQDGVAVYTRDGGVSFLVTPESAQFIRERLGEPTVAEIVNNGTVGQILDRGYQAIRGWGAHSGARLFGKPRSPQSPSSRGVSIRVFSCRHIDTDDRLRDRGIILPDAAITRSTIDREAESMVPSGQNKEADNVQAEHTELLKQIADNTRVLPKMQEDLRALVKLEERRSRLTQAQYERERTKLLDRARRWVN